MVQESHQKSVGKLIKAHQLKTLHILFALLGIIMAACAASPSEQYAVGDLLLSEDFDAPSAWESYVSPEQNLDFRIQNGVYRARAADNTLMWVLNETLHDNVVIEVETTQLSTYRDNAYGLICRASPTNDGSGYYFLISGDGHFTIRRGAGKEIKPLIQWHPSDTIVQDQAINRMRVICIDDYLALWVNDQFVAETRDDLFLRGYAGLSAGVVEDGDLDVEFDRLTIWAASLK